MDLLVGHHHSRASGVLDGVLCLRLGHQKKNRLIVQNSMHRGIPLEILSYIHTYIYT